MAVPRCYNCAYCIVDPQVWLRALWQGEDLVPQCANHPWWPGQLHDVSGVACRHYSPKPALPQGDNVRMIPLGDGCYAYVDKADYDELNQHVWHLNNGYASRREKGRRIYMHTEIMRPPQGKVVDHTDRNLTNNCRCNLRVCTQAENLCNRRRRNGTRSRFKGVTYRAELHKWYARCGFEGKKHWRGYFDDEVEAARAYDRMAVEHFGVYAHVNFPEEWPPERRAEVHALFQTQSAGQEREKKKATGRKKKSHAKTRRRREGKRGTKEKAAHKPAGGTSKSPKRRTRRKATGR